MGESAADGIEAEGSTEGNLCAECAAALEGVEGSQGGVLEGDPRGAGESGKKVPCAEAKASESQGRGRRTGGKEGGGCQVWEWSNKRLDSEGGGRCH